MDKVVYFEIPYEDKARASKFYSEIFGWKLFDFPDMDYTMVYAAEVDKNNMVVERGAINGGMFPRNDAVSKPVVVIGVQSVDDAIKKVVSAGGTIVTPKQPLPKGSYARVADCEGNVIGLADSST